MGKLDELPPIPQIPNDCITVCTGARKDVGHLPIPRDTSDVLQLGRPRGRRIRLVWICQIPYENLQNKGICPRQILRALAGDSSGSHLAVVGARGQQIGLQRIKVQSSNRPGMCRVSCQQRISGTIDYNAWVPKPELAVFQTASEDTVFLRRVRAPCHAPRQPIEPRNVVAMDSSRQSVIGTCCSNVRRVDETHLAGDFVCPRVRTTPSWPPTPYESSPRSTISSSVAVLNEASNAPATVPTAKKGRCAPGDQAKVAVRFSWRRRPPRPPSPAIVSPGRRVFGAAPMS